jgi:chemosensory pili system protein ChpA (sensor histidine kinase/response regulator)
MSALLNYDTGPLNWVRGDIESALQAAVGRLQAYSEDTDLSNALRLAGDDAHQVAGALRMVGLEGAATLARALEECLAASSGEQGPDHEMLRAMRNAFEGLSRWVKNMADGRGGGELALFPLYRRLRELQGAERVFEGELFFPDLRTRVHGKAPSDAPTGTALTAKVKSARGVFQRGLLAFLRGNGAEDGLRRMRDALAEIEQIAPSQASRTFWWACVGFVDSLIANGVEADFHVKQLLARIDLQMRRLMEGSPQVAERLLRDALFFVAKSQTMEGRAAEVRHTFGLDRYLPGTVVLDPEALARMRPVMDALKSGLKAARDAWHAQVEGAGDQIAPFKEQLARMQPQARILENSGLSGLLEQMGFTAEATQNHQGSQLEALNLEIAATLLFLQNAVDNEDVLQADFAARTQKQLQRLVALTEGRTAPLDDTPDSSERRAAERDMLLHMAHEVSHNLKQMEEVLDAFFRDAEQRGGLAQLPNLASQAQGALVMLELGEAASLLGAAAEVISEYSTEGYPDTAIQGRVADAFSSLGLYIEAHCAGRADALNILRPVLIDFGLMQEESADEDQEDTVEAGLEKRKLDVQSAYLAWRDEPQASEGDAKKKFIETLTELGRDAELIDDAALLQSSRSALQASQAETLAPIELDSAIEELTGMPLPSRPEPAALADESEAIESILAALADADPLYATLAAACELPETHFEAVIEVAQAVPQAEIEYARPVWNAEIEYARPVWSAVIEYAEPVIEAENDIQFEEPVAEAMTWEPVEASEATTETDPTGILTIIPEGSEPELLEIFLEEASEVLASLDAAVETCRSLPDDHEALTVIRRGFHTLKGSGRMVGLTDLGETAWGMEQLMNGWLADDKPATHDLLGAVGMACSLFRDWVDALKTSTVTSLPAPELLQAAKRVAHGQPLEEAAAETVAAEAVEALEAPETIIVAEPVDSESVNEMVLVVAVADVAEAVEVFEPVSAPEHVEPESVDELALAVAAEFFEATTPSMPETESFESDKSEPVACDAAGSTPDEEDQAAIADATEDTAFVPDMPDEICIGGISMSTGLYEIFTTEAQQHVRTLRAELMRMAEAPASSVSETARRAIHTLAGIAGTSGFIPLSDLAHALELYWNRFNHTALPTAHLPLMQETVERLHAMVDEILAANAPVPASDLVAALGELEEEQFVPPPVEAEQSDMQSVWADENDIVDVPTEEQVAAEISEDFADADADADADAEIVDIHDGADDVIELWTEQLVPEESGELAASDAGVAETAPNAPALLDMTGLIPESRAASHVPVFERREVADDVDEQLLPIFLEEADMLVPDTSAQLRAWGSSPTDIGARDALRRNLHTLKGSARMAGAMRLGELTHVMESRVIAVIEGQLEADHDIFDKLEAEFDRLSDAVEKLKAGDASIEEAVREIQPVAAPVEPVLESQLVVRDNEQQAAEPAAHAASRDSQALTLRVRADWVDRMVNQAGEVAIARSRIESEVFAFKRHVAELSDALVRLRSHIREVEIQAESQMQATFQSHGDAEHFDPLEFDRFTRFQEVTRFLAESVNDISTVQHILLARLGEADAALIQQTRLNRELQQNLLRVRMVPLYSVAERLYRTVRQTARDVGKRAQLDIQGGELEVDRSVLEKITAPIEHLLRNALAHGVEAPEVRHAAGKAEFGEITLTARQSGNEMMLTVKDDGRGLDFERIRQKAESLGLLTPGIEPSETLLAQMIFAAGFSTAESVSQVAGRGVGMDVVKSEISALGGRIDITSVSGSGTTFNIYLPLTLAMTQAVMIEAARQEYALPAPLVQQVVELKPEALEKALAAGEMEWRGERYPLTYLPRLLGDADSMHEVQRYNPVILLKSGSSQAAILVDVVSGTREVVVKNIGPQIARVTGVSGATVRGDGRVILILNPVPLALRWLSQPRVVPSVPQLDVPAVSVSETPLVLVVDDSLTVRKITSRLLTREGFRVDSAKDGVDALEKMHDLSPDVVLLDVEMPRMDGFELARVMRNDERLKHVPIIMITSRTADKHRNHAMEIGVNVYLGKPYQEQQLLDHIAEQIGQQAAVAE